MNAYTSKVVIAATLAVCAGDTTLGDDRPGAAVIDLSRDEDRRVIVEPTRGHQPDTVLLADDRTMFVAFGYPDRGLKLALRRSDDAGLTWSDHLPVPESFGDRGSFFCPSLQRLADRDGTERLVLFSSPPDRLVRAVSEDNGRTWSAIRRLFPADHDYQPEYRGGQLRSVIQLKDGSHLAMYHGRAHRDRRGNLHRLQLFQTQSRDGGVSWSLPRAVHQEPELVALQLTDAWMIRSPDGQRLLTIVSDVNAEQSFHMISIDEGRNWSAPQPLAPGLVGADHTAVFAPDGRLVIGFTDRRPTSTTRGAVAWVGTFDDLVKSQSGAYRVRLFDSSVTPNGRAGLEVFPDGALLYTVACSFQPDEAANRTVSAVRFTLEEIDRLSAR